MWSVAGEVRPRRRTPRRMSRHALDPIGLDVWLGPPRLRRRLAGAAGARLASVEHVTDEEVIGESADHAADQGSDDWYPEVVAELEAANAVGAGDGHLAPAGEEREQARPEVTGGIDRVSGVGSERGADREDDEADDERANVADRRHIPGVGHRQHADQEERGTHRLIHERPSKGAAEVLGGEGGEDRIASQRVAEV